jgi:hypothetical protein
LRVLGGFPIKVPFQALQNFLLLFVWIMVRGNFISICFFKKKIYEKKKFFIFYINI